MDSAREVFVWLSLEGKDIPVGRLWFYSRKGRQSASFEYNRSWLAHPEKFALDPALQLSEGVMHTAGEKIFGAIDDSAPDRWGRMLMRRAARTEGKNRTLQRTLQRTLLEADYLLGVSDEARLGALRFSVPEDKPSNSSRKNIVHKEIFPGVCRALPIPIKKIQKNDFFLDFLPCRLPKEPINRVGGHPLIEWPSSHTTVRTGLVHGGSTGSVQNL